MDPETAPLDPPGDPGATSSQADARPPEAVPADLAGNVAGPTPTAADPTEAKTKALDTRGDESSATPVQAYFARVSAREHAPVSAARRDQWRAGLGELGRALGWSAAVLVAPAAGGVGVVAAGAATAVWALAVVEAAARPLRRVPGKPASRIGAWVELGIDGVAGTAFEVGPLVPWLVVLFALVLALRSPTFGALSVAGVSAIVPAFIGRGVLHGVASRELGTVPARERGERLLGPPAGDRVRSLVGMGAGSAATFIALAFSGTLAARLLGPAGAANELSALALTLAFAWSAQYFVRAYLYAAFPVAMRTQIKREARWRLG